MESSPCFDLNEAIQRWRERLIQLRSFGAEDLEELENHLRESVAGLQTAGLSPEEAFLVATERLGPDQRLADEYAKTNAKGIWTRRAVWMLGGVVAAMVMETFVRTGADLSSTLGRWLGLDTPLIVMLSLLVEWTITAACVGLGCWLIARRNRWLMGRVSNCFQRPIWTSVALVLALLGLQMLSHLVPNWWKEHLHLAGTLTVADRAVFRAWGLPMWVLDRLVWVAAIPLLAAYLWKAAPSGGGSRPAVRFESLRDDERTLAGQLEGRGLSRSEAQLLIVWRRGYRPVSTETKTRFVSGLWLEGGFWMTVGMVANWMLRGFVANPSWMQTDWISSSSALWQHMGGMVSTFLPLTLAGTAIAVFWNGATGSRQRKGWRHRVFNQSPVRAAVLFAALACLWIGLTAYLALVQSADALLPILSHSRIGVIWWAGKSLLIDYLIPVFLLVWVGNRYQTARKSA